MKFCLLFVSTIAVVALAAPPEALPKQKQEKVESKEFLQRQKDILLLFKSINQKSYDKNIMEIAKTWEIEKHTDAYTKPEYAKAFWMNYKHGMLPRDETFSIFYSQHLKQAISLFKVFFYAKDFETLYKTAAWARQHMNQGMFVYSFSVALVHRPDTYGMTLPPIYEIYPHYFFNSEVIELAHKFKQMRSENHKLTNDPKGFVINANYSGWYLNVHPEQSMSYFMEDVGMNSFYYYFNIYYPFWMMDEGFEMKNTRRGEQYYYVHQQLMARFYMERLANEFGEIKHFDYDHPIETGYYPSMMYPNGLQFPTRPSNVDMYRTFRDGEQSHHCPNFSTIYMKIRESERRINDAIDIGFYVSKEEDKLNVLPMDDINMLGNMMEGNPNSPHRRYYGSLPKAARHYLGYSMHPLNFHKVAPSALEHFETSLRDPMFYQLYKRITMMFQKYKDYLPPYEYNDLTFPGVKIEDFEMDKMFTYLDMFDINLLNAIYVDETEFERSDMNLYARQFRINHKPFTYKIKVNSDKEVKGVVKIFIGPKYDEYGRELKMNENRMNFFELENFMYTFKPGMNIIERTCGEDHFVKDRTTSKQLYQKIMNGMEGKEAFKWDSDEVFYGFPKRMMLPSGRIEGMKYQMYVMISPYVPSKDQPDDWYYPVSTGYTKFVDNYPLGYPFDRRIDQYAFKVPNSYIKDVVIYYKEEVDINKTFDIGHF